MKRYFNRFLLLSASLGLLVSFSAWADTSAGEAASSGAPPVPAKEAQKISPSPSELAPWYKAVNASYATFYISSSTIQKTGHLVKMWELIDFKQPSQDMYDNLFWSWTVLIEYECEEKLTRPIVYNFYSKPMGGGKNVGGDSEPGKWKSIKTRITERLRLNACGDKLLPLIDIPVNDDPKGIEYSIEPYAYNN